MFAFSERPLALLRAAGWSETYRYDTTHYETLLRTEGYPVHQSAIEFMRRFGGLTIIYPHPNVAGSTEELEFGLSYGVAHVFRMNAREASAEVGEDLCFFGRCYTGYLDLLMAESGTVYADGMGLFCRVAASGEEAIENICASNYGEQI